MVLLGAAPAVRGQDLGDLGPVHPRHPFRNSNTTFAEIRAQYHDWSEGYVSPYHSLGKTRAYSGEVDSREGLSAALEACSYKNEIIMISTTGTFFDAAYQTLAALHRHGLAHVMLVVSQKESCDANAKLRPDMCCVWTSPVHPPNQHAFGNHRFLMFARGRLATRALRRSYNVLFLVRRGGGRGAVGSARKAGGGQRCGCV